MRGLDAGWKQLAERLQEAGPAAKVSIEVAGDGRVKLNVDKLGALGEPRSLTWLRQRVEKMLPKIDLPDLLFEVNAWTGFLGAFVHLGDGTTRMKDLSTSVVALLVSEACNIGLAPVVNPGYEALTRARLVHVDQYYLRADTIAAANARLIAAQADIPIVRYWGEGLLASVDGLRFQVPMRTINAAPSPKYFGFKRGITWLNAVNDQVAGIGQMVVPGTPRDSLHILDALLNLDGGVKPEMVATDNASYSDMVFGLFKILGYNAAHVRPRRPPHPSRGGVRRVRADRQDRAPAARRRPGRRHLPPSDAFVLREVRGEVPVCVLVAFLRLPQCGDGIRDPLGGKGVVGHGGSCLLVVASGHPRRRGARAGEREEVQASAPAVTCGQAASMVRTPRL